MSPAWFKRQKTAAEQKTTSGSEPAAVTVASKNVSVSKLLTEELVLFLPDARDKNELMEALVGRLSAARKVGEPGPLLKKVLEREQGISTTLDTGLSLPHARLEGIADIATALGLLPQGVPDPKQPELQIRAMFLFFSPNRQDAFTRHLHLLRTVSSLFQPAFIDQLLAAGTPAKVLELIRKQEG